MRTDLIFVLLSALMRVMCSQLHDYIFVPEKVNWTDAQMYCRQHYTDLATINNQQDNNNLLKMAGPSTVWIGLYRTSGTTPFIWSDQSSSTYADWEPGQPNNHDGIQWCVHIHSNSHLWNDAFCENKSAFVCHLEKKRQIVRVEVKSSQNLNDPRVKKEILAKIEKILKEKGLEEHAKLSWINQSDGNVFQKKDCKNKSNATEYLRLKRH